MLKIKEHKNNQKRKKGVDQEVWNNKIDVIEVEIENKNTLYILVSMLVIAVSINAMLISIFVKILQKI